MAVHDAYARVTPYELLLPAPDFADQRFPAVESEAASRGVDLANPAAFATSGAVQGILADLRPEDHELASDREPAAQASALAHVLYFAFHLWCAQRAPTASGDSPSRDSPDLNLSGSDSPDADLPDRARLPTVALLSRPTLRALSAADAVQPGWEAALLGRAGYLQLPQHMVWAEEPDAERPDSVDGFFWAATHDGAFHAAAVTGMRPGRPGYGFVPVPPQPLDSLSAWTAAPARERGDDFATDLPGAEIDGLMGIRTPAEVVKLLAFALERWVQRSSATEPESEASPSGLPARSSLPYVVL